MARTILPPEQLSKEGTHFYEAINGESPLACVLIAGASLEQAVASLFRTTLLRTRTTQSPRRKARFYLR